MTKLETISIIDTETTGLDPNSGNCIEVAVVYYSIEYASVIDCYSGLIANDENPLERINHIHPRMLENYGSDSDFVWGEVANYANMSDALVAHGASFDKSWTPEDFPKMPWICTLRGVTWPKQSKSGSSLTNLCLDHGIGVVDPHRALNDCLMLARLMTRVSEQYDLRKLLSMGLRPMAEFEALVSFAEKDIAKENGFNWERDKKRWVKEMAIEDAASLPFKTVRIHHTQST